jgi:hypothetical protein
MHFAFLKTCFSFVFTYISTAMTVRSEMVAGLIREPWIS